jgi:hypothetical protein
MDSFEVCHEMRENVQNTIAILGFSNIPPTLQSTRLRQNDRFVHTNN